MAGMGSFAGEVGKGFVKMSWNDQGLRDGLNGGGEKVRNNLQIVLERYAPEIENWMKDNAKWTDRTGNARNGLAARPFSDRDGTGIVLYHQVPYGIWLEVRFSGKYAVIVPAMEEWGQRVMEGTQKMLDRMR